MLFPFVQRESRLLPAYAIDDALPSKREMERVIDADQKIYTGHFTESARHTEQVDYFHYEHDVRTRELPVGMKGPNDSSAMRSSTDLRPTQRSDDRREAFLDALDRGLLESNLDAINIAEIFQQAAVSRSAFHFYFENKAAAVAALLERILDVMFAVQRHLHGGVLPAVRPHLMPCSPVASRPAKGTSIVSGRCWKLAVRTPPSATSGTTSASRSWNPSRR